MRVALNRSILISGVFLASLTPVAPAQQPTIPEALAEAGTSLTGGTNIPSGPPISLAELLAQVDLIVAGTVKRSASYLSEDKHHVYTDLEVRQARVLFQARPVTTSRPGMPPTLTITQWGGKVTINGLSFTEEHELLPLLPDGTEGIFLLTQEGPRYFLAGKLYGAFATSQGKVKPLARKRGFAAEHGPRLGRRIPQLGSESRIAPRLRDAADHEYRWIVALEGGGVTSETTIINADEMRVIGTTGSSPYHASAPGTWEV